MKLFIKLNLLFLVGMFFSCEQVSDSDKERLQIYLVNRDSLDFTCVADTSDINRDVLVYGSMDAESFCYTDKEMSLAKVYVSDRILDLYLNGFVEQSVFLGHSFTSYYRIEQDNGFEFTFRLGSPLFESIEAYSLAADSIFREGIYEVGRIVEGEYLGHDVLTTYELYDRWEFRFGFNSKNGIFGHHLLTEGGQLEITNVEKNRFSDYVEYNVRYHITGNLECPTLPGMFGDDCYEIDIVIVEDYYIEL